MVNVPKLAALLSLSWLALATPVALAQSLTPAEGRLSAVAFAPIDGGSTFAIEMLDDTDLNVRLVADIERSLAASAHRPAADGRYILTLETAEIADLQGDGGGIGTLNVDTLLGVQMHVNLWSSTRNSLLQGRQRSVRTTPLVRLDMVVRDRGGRQVTWQAQAFGEIRGIDRYRVLQQIVPAMLQSLGETVEAGTITIR